MKYKIEISGMHCSGCANLIKMSLEDEGLQEVTVNGDEGSAVFSSSLHESEISNLLEKIFKDLEDYSYSELNILN